VPALADIMTAVQWRHIKLWFAGKFRNWDLANYELRQIKVSLVGVSKPPVWRRLLVPATIRLDRLHAAIQTAMGWGDLAGCAIRVSLPWNVAAADIELFLDAWSAMRARLSRRAA